MTKPSRGWCKNGVGTFHVLQWRQERDQVSDWAKFEWTRTEPVASELTCTHCGRRWLVLHKFAWGGGKLGPAF